MLAFVGCAREPQLVRHAEFRLLSDDTPGTGAVPSLPARVESAELVPRDDFHQVEGVLFSPDGCHLAVADVEIEGFGCVGSLRTTLWLYETETWHAIVVRPLGFAASDWGFAEDGSALVIATPRSPSGVDAGPEAISLTTGDAMPASVAPLAPLAPSTTRGALRVTASGAEVHVARGAKPWLRLGPPVAAVAAGGALESGEVFFGVRWPNGSFALWDVDRSRPIGMDPPPPAAVSGVAVEDDVLLVAGRDGSFWRYQPGPSGAFDGTRVRRNDPLVVEVFDVRGFAGREKTDDFGLVGLLGGDPDAPLAPKRPLAIVACFNAGCGYRLDDDSLLRVVASDQPGQITVWNGVEGELFGGDASTAFVCVAGSLVVAPERCRDRLRVPRLFTQARLRSEALTRLAPG